MENDELLEEKEPLFLDGEQDPDAIELEGVEEACVAASMGIALRDAGT